MAEKTNTIKLFQIKRWHLNSLFYFSQTLPSSDLISSQPKNKINHNFWSTGHRLKFKRLNWLELNFLMNSPTFKWQKTFFFCIVFFNILRSSLVKQSPSGTKPFYSDLNSPYLDSAQLQLVLFPSVGMIQQKEQIVQLKRKFNQTKLS